MSRAQRTWIVLFRGVGGDTLLPVKPLREALTEAGFDNVRSFINTGNVVLTSGDRPEEIIARIAPVVLREFQFAKAILVADLAEWQRLIDENPFPADVPQYLHAFLMEREPAAEAVEALRAKVRGTEQFSIKGRVLYYYTPDGFSNSRLHTKIERTLGLSVTARNWNSVLKLHALASGLQSPRAGS